MKNELWNQVSEIFQSALKLGPEERSGYLKNACGEDQTLHRQVRSLLEAHEAADDTGFIDAPALHLAARLLVEEEAKTGESVGHYKIVKRIGAGGMGEVYLADDPTLKRPVAIKLLLSETAGDRDRIRRFVQEARAASALNHPNILTVYQVGDHKDSRFIATEYIQGETLRDKLGSDGPLPLSVVLDIAVQVAAALDAAHKAGIVHRDIKPENIMVRDDGLVKVLDFGLAKLSGASAETAELRPAGGETATLDQFQTRAGTIMGTAAYMSPEQARGRQVDARTDIWSLGVVIFEMVGGRQPFEGETTNDIIAAILRSEPESLAGVPEDLNRIIARALCKDVADRFQEAGELLTELRGVKQDLEFSVKLEQSTPALTKGTQSISAPLTEIRPRTTISSAAQVVSEIRDHKLAASVGVLVLVFVLSGAYFMFGTETGAGIANQLGIAPVAAEQQVTSVAENPDPEAYQFVQQAAYHLNKRTAEDIRKGISLLEQATAKDPSFARAYSSLAFAYITLRVYNSRLSRNEMKELGQKARTSAMRARELNDSLPDVHAALGLTLDDQWDFVAAENEYKRAIQMNPDLASVRLAYSINLSWRGRYEEALAQINKAYDLDPGSRSIAFNIGARLAEVRRFDEAIAQYKRVLEMEPNHPLTHFVFAQALEATGRYAEAIPEYRAANVLLEKDSVEDAVLKAAALTEALNAAGAQGYWRKQLEFSQQEYDQGYGEAYRIAVCYARLGEYDEALKQLEVSFADHDLFLPWIRTESAFDPISADPRFDQLVRRIGLKT